MKCPKSDIGSKVMIAVKQLLKYLITAFKQVLKMCKLYNFNLGQRIELFAKFQLDRLNLSWNSGQTAVKIANNTCQTAITQF